MKDCFRPSAWGRPTKTLARVTETRRHPRYQIEVEIRVYGRDSAVVRGHSVDISESGISALLSEEVRVGEVVRLEFAVAESTAGHPES